MTDPKFVTWYLLGMTRSGCCSTTHRTFDGATTLCGRPIPLERRGIGQGWQGYCPKCAL